MNLKVITAERLNAAGQRENTQFVLINGGRYRLHPPIGYVWADKEVQPYPGFLATQFTRGDAVHQIGRQRFRVRGVDVLPFELHPGEEFITDREFNEQIYLTEENNKPFQKEGAA